MISVTDTRTGRAHIVTRMSSVQAFLKMIKSRCVLPGPSLSPTGLFPGSFLHMFRPYAGLEKHCPKWITYSLFHHSRPPTDISGMSMMGHRTRSSTQRSPPLPSQRTRHACVQATRTPSDSSGPHETRRSWRSISNVSTATFGHASNGVMQLSEAVIWWRAFLHISFNARTTLIRG